MAEASGACHILVRSASDADAAVRALEASQRDLYESDVFAELDGEFGTYVDGTDIRYTPSFCSKIEVTRDGPTFWFDADDVLDTFPEVVPLVLEQLRRRLVEAGVRQATIGWPAS